jgi:hypothetical protein
MTLIYICHQYLKFFYFFHHIDTWFPFGSSIHSNLSLLIYRYLKLFFVDTKFFDHEFVLLGIPSLGLVLFNHHFFFVILFSLST